MIRFEKVSKTFETTAGADTFTMVEGQITGIYNVDTLGELEFIGDSSKYDKELVGAALPSDQ